jgi:succinate-semialdehyde dehydrogenase/glutarate-semialdehyde dehydrogenase
VTLRSVNPATGETVASYDETSAQDVQRTIERVHQAFLGWKRTSMADRADGLRRTAEVLRAGAQDHARLMACEMGKPVRDGRGEIEKCAWACEHYAEHAERYLAREPVTLDGARAFVTFAPLGVVLAVMPWNFPFWQVFRFAAPALMAGNTALLKHASSVPGCALAIERVFTEAGLPPDVFRTLLIGSEAIPAAIDHPLVRAVTVTGSGAAGSAVARRAGERLKKSVLELGGSDPYVVLEDADLDLAATVCARARLVNAGQSCIAGKRFIVVRAVQQAFERRFVERMAAARMGDPLREETELGPQARGDLRDGLHRQVTESVARGARLLLGGTVPDGAGAFYPATVLTDVRPGMPVYEEEVFGPVAAIVPVEDEAAAIEAANDSVFGLGGAVFTRDLARGEHIAAQLLACGFACVNDNVRSDPRLPFGGIKESGYGRELAGYGIKEFVNIKTVVVAGAP